LEVDPVDVAVGQIDCDTIRIISARDKVLNSSAIQIGTTKLVRRIPFGPVDVSRTLGKRGSTENNNREKTNYDVCIKTTGTESQILPVFCRLGIRVIGRFGLLNVVRVECRGFRQSHSQRKVGVVLCS